MFWFLSYWYKLGSQKKESSTIYIPNKYKVLELVPLKYFFCLTMCASNIVQFYIWNIFPGNHNNLDFIYLLIKKTRKPKHFDRLAPLDLKKKKSWKKPWIKKNQTKPTWKNSNPEHIPSICIYKYILIFVCAHMSWFNPSWEICTMQLLTLSPTLSRVGRRIRKNPCKTLR